MAANETTPLLGDSNDGRNAAAPAPASVDAEVQQEESQQDDSQQAFQGPIELKIAALAHFNSIIDSTVSGALGLVYGPLSRNPPKYYYASPYVRDLAMASVVMGIFTIAWGLANVLLFHFHRKLLGPTLLSFLIHGLLALIAIPLFLQALDRLMSGEGRQCQHWDGGQYYPADPKCVAWLERLNELVYTGMVFFLGAGVSHVVLAYLYFAWTWRQFMLFLRSLPWSNPPLSAQDGNYRGSAPLPIVPTGGVTFELGIKFWGPGSTTRTNTEAGTNISTLALAIWAWIMLVLVSVWILSRLFFW